MRPLHDRKIRFSDVVYAIGSTPKALRLWLQRGLVTLESENTGGWREFSFADIAILVVIRRLVDFGMGIEEASQIANDAIRSRSLFLFTRKKASAKAFSAGFINVDMIVWRDAGWRTKLLYPYDTPPDDVDTYLLIRLEEVIAGAFARLDDDGGGNG